MKRVTKGLIIFGVVAGIAGAAAAVWRPWEGGAANDALRFETAKVDKGAIAARVTATGTLSPRNTVQVGAQVSGRIAEVHVDFNDHVKKGDIIARLDTTLLEAQVAGARASLAVAEANRKQASAELRQAEIAYRRQKELRQANLNAAADLDAALANLVSGRAAVAAREAQVEQSKAQVAQAELNVGYATIISPVDGVVLSRAIDVGQTVAASFQAPTLFTIAEDLARMQIDTSVGEGDVGKILSDMKATFAVDAYPSRKFEGRVRQVRNSPTTVSGVVTYNAVIDVDNADLALRPGMTANVTFVVAEITDTVRIPNAALRFRPDADLKRALFAQAFPDRQGGAGAGKRAGGMAGGPGEGGGPGMGGPPGGGNGNGDGGDPNRRMLWKVVDGRAKPVRVKVGLSDGTTTALVEGELAPGDELVVDVLNPPAKTTAPRLF